VYLHIIIIETKKSNRIAFEILSRNKTSLTYLLFGFKNLNAIVIFLSIYNYNLDKQDDHLDFINYFFFFFFNIHDLDGFI